MGFDGVCICKAAAEPLGYLPLQQLPENQKDVQKQKPFLRSEVYHIEWQEKCLLDEVSGIRSEVGWQVQFPLNENMVV